MLEAEGHGGGRRLVDDVHHLEARHVAGVLRRLAANLVEIGRHGDDRLVERPDLLPGVVAELLRIQAWITSGGYCLPSITLWNDAVSHVALDALGHVVALAEHGLDGFLAHDHVLRRRTARRWA